MGAQWWTDGRPLYQLHSLGASGAPATNPNVDAEGASGSGLARLEPWLDHVRNLGCGGVLLTPVLVSSTHGYDTVDPFHIDQRLGSEDDFASFVEACHTRDLRLVLDGVFNHVGRDFPAFRSVLAQRAASPFVDWFHLDFDGDAGDGFGYQCFEGHRELVTLNHANDDVGAWATDVCSHWLARGIDGWRFDAAYAIPNPFLRRLVTEVRALFPHAFVFGEVIHGDYARVVEATTLDALTQYELHKAIWSSLNDANFFELQWALERHRSLIESFAPLTFVGNHDVTRIASQLHDPRHLGAALALLFTLPGVPCVYYGDEFAWRGVKEHRPGGDDAIRPPLPHDGPPTADAADGLLALHRERILFRSARPWLTRADVEVVEVTNRRMTYSVSSGEHAVQVQLDVDATPPYAIRDSP